MKGKQQQRRESNEDGKEAGKIRRQRHTGFSIELSGAALPLRRARAPEKKAKTSCPTTSHDYHHFALQLA